MSYKCLDCGEGFDEPKEWKEYRGECHGMSAYEEMVGCPHCEGDFEETTPCAICGVELTEAEAMYGLCEDCVSNQKKDIHMCKRIGDNDTESVELNSFLAIVFSKEEIEEILFSELKHRQKYIGKSVEEACEKYINLDVSWFAEMLAEEVSKDEKAKV